MKNLIRRILREQTQENPLSKVEVSLFKYINKNRDKYSTKQELMNFIKRSLEFFGKPQDESKYYYELYISNYRPNGDYENITSDEFKQVRSSKAQRTTNVHAYEFVTSKLPFKGSNLEGGWDYNQKNQPYYVVKSYNWYPIFLFINNQWYEVSVRYSSSTGKQISKSRPRVQNIIDVTPTEMSKLIDGVSFDDIKQKRVEDFVTSIKSDIIGIPKLITVDYNNPKKVRFVINDVVQEDGKIKIFVEILKAGPVIDGKMVVSPETYNEEFIQKIEDGIEYNIIRNNSDFLDVDNTIFEFKHPSI